MNEEQTASITTSKRLKEALRTVGRLPRTRSDALARIAELEAEVARLRLAETDLGNALGSAWQKNARLTEERDNWRDTADTLGDETHQQREDIRRLVEALESAGGDYTLLTEMKARY